MSETFEEPKSGHESGPNLAIRGSRRSFLGTAVGLTGAALAAGAWRPAPEAQGVTAAANKRTFTAAKADLVFGTKDVGSLRSVEGGWVSAEVVLEAPPSGSYYGGKHLRFPKYDELELEIGLSMESDVYGWINDTWTGLHPRKTGAIVLADLNLNVQQRRSFQNALITETTIPACDASSKDAGLITLTFAPELVQTTKGSGKLTTGGSKQKDWMVSNFRLDIQGLDATKVSKIDEFTVKQIVSSDAFGEQRQVTVQAGKLVFGDLVVTLLESGATTWEAWADDFIVKGNNGNAQEKSAVLGLMAPDLKTYLAHVDFFNVGIFRYEDASVGGSTDTAKKVEAHLYCERAEFHLGAPLPVTCPNCVYYGPPPVP